MYAQGNVYRAPDPSDGGGPGGAPQSPLSDMRGPAAAAPAPTELLSAAAIARNEGVFATLSDSEFQTLMASAKFIQVPTGYELRTRQQRIYVLTSGKVSCRLVDAAGIQYALSTGQSGDVFGEIAFSDHPKQSALPGKKIYIEATEPVTMIGFLPEVWNAVVGNNINSQKFLLGLTTDRLLRMNEFASHAVQVDPELENQAARTVSERAADWLTNKIGTWRFVIGGISFMAVYSAMNWVASAFGLSAWDAYPFVFLNLILSTASGFAVPILLISQNRQAHIDRSAARVNQRMILNLTKEIQEMRASGTQVSEERLREIIREELSRRNPESK